MTHIKMIYIADDEDNIRNLIKSFLLKTGYEVEDFANDDSLLDAFAKRPADMVVVDVMMPGSNGYVVCKELRKQSTVPIIMITARDSDLDYATGFDLGCDEYLVKPFSPTAFVKRVETIFEKVEFNQRSEMETLCPMG